jgi:two-component system sensor histidine kinase KdpD
MPIDLRIRRDGAKITLAVMDRGPGVPEGDRERIFEPFQRLHNTPSDTGGTGLGLSIARGLATTLGGAVRYEPREGGGSVFIFELPAAEGPPDPPEP